MKKLLFIAFLFISVIGFAQTSTVVPMDKSPMDMSYYPVNYPILKIQDKVTEPLLARVIYSRPQVNGRIIFGGLQKYGEVWRLGANEATEIEFFKEVKINNKKIKKGRYTLYAIPYVDKWVIILNKDTDIWGSFRYDSTKDVVRISLPVTSTDFAEDLTIYFEKTNTGANLNMVWDKAKVSLPVYF